MVKFLPALADLSGSLQDAGPNWGTVVTASDINKLQRNDLNSFGNFGFSTEGVQYRSNIINRAGPVPISHEFFFCPESSRCKKLEPFLLYVSTPS